MLKVFESSRAKLLGGVAGLALIAVAPVALAATTANTTISITIDETVAISNLAATIGFGTWDGTGAEQMADDLCVWSNDGSPGQCSIDLTTDNGSMVLQQGAETIPFTVAWANTSGQTTGTNVPYNSATNFTMSATTTPTCGGGDNSSIVIDILEADLAGAPASATAYDAVLTVTVAAVP
jgi:hypothetical protein